MEHYRARAAQGSEAARGLNEAILTMLLVDSLHYLIYFL